MKLSIQAGSNSQSVNVFIRDSTSSSGTGLTGLVYNSAGLTAYYSFSGANTTATAITLATLAAVNSAYSSGGFKEIDATNMPGWYRLDLPNAVLAIAKGRSVALHLRGATNMVPLPVEIELTGWDNQNATTGGLSNLDAAITSRMATYTQPIGFLTATFPATVASTTNITAGTITTVTNLTNAPTNGDLTAAMKTSIQTELITYGALKPTVAGRTVGISASGAVTLVDTITTYTGNTPQTGDSFARIGNNGSALTALAPAATALSTAVWTNARAGYLDILQTQTDGYLDVNVKLWVDIPIFNPEPPTVAQIASAVDAIITVSHGAGSYIRNTEPDNSSITLIKAKTDQMTYTVPNVLDSNTKYQNDVEIIGSGVSGDLWRGNP